MPEEPIPKNHSKHTCACGCRQTFICNDRDHRRYFDRGCASRANAKNTQRPKVTRRKIKVGFRPKQMKGLGQMNEKIREYEDKQIAAGKMPPRMTYRDVTHAHIAEDIAKKERRKKKK